MLQEAAAQEVAQSQIARCISLIRETSDARPRPAVPTSATKNLLQVAFVEGPLESNPSGLLLLVVQKLLELPLPFATAVSAAAALT